MPLQQEIDDYLTQTVKQDPAAADSVGNAEAATTAGSKRRAASPPAAQAAKEPRHADAPGIQLCSRSLIYASVSTWKGQKRLNLRQHFIVRNLHSMDSLLTAVTAGACSTIGVSSSAAAVACRL